MGAIEIVKKHPVAVGGGILAVVVVVILISSSGGGSQVVGTTGGSVADSSGDASQMAQINAQLQAHSMDTQAAYQANQDNNATQVALAQIAKDIQAGAYAVQSQEITAQQQTIALQSTLSAHVQESTIAAGVQQTQIQTQASVDTTKIYADALIQQSQINAQTSAAAIAAASRANTCTGLKSFFGAC